MNEQEEFQIQEIDVQLGEKRLRLQHLRWNSAAAALKPCLVFLHDSLGCIALWRNFPELLAKACGCNVLVYDRQGYGQSSPFTEDRKPDYLELEAHVLRLVLMASGIEEALLFGHSDGGSIALIAAAAYPQQVKAVMAEGAHVFVEELTLAGVREAKKSFTATFLRERLARYHGDKAAAVVAAWTDTWLSPEFNGWNIEHYLSRIQCPVLVIQGVQDEYGTEKQVNAIVQQVVGPAQKFMVPDAGHTPHKENTEVVLNAAVSFLKVHQLV